MKRSYFSYCLRLALICAALALSGCGSIVSTGSAQQLIGSGKLITKDYDLSEFDSINAGSDFKVNIQQGDKFAVSVTADDNIMPIVTVTSANGELRLNVKPGAYGFNNVTMKADVSLPAVKSVTLDSNATANLDSIKSPSLGLILKSNGIVSGAVETGKLLVDGGGNAQAKLDGSADTLTVKGAGNAIVRLEGLTAKDALIDLNSNAMATVQATQKLDYSAVGNAGLIYTGGAKLGKQQTGGNGYARAR